MKQRNFYNILEIEDFATIDEVKKAFRKLALIYHPDLNTSADTGEKFKTLVKAYETLRNSATKRKYDEVLKNGFDLSQLLNTALKEETETEKRRNRYFKVKKEKDELEEIENLASYEKSLNKFPFKNRIVIIVLIQITGIMLILRDWYAKESFIAWGAFVFFLASLILWNEYYKHYWRKTLRNTEENKNLKYDKSAYKRFIRIFAAGILILILLINVKKIWHLHYFPNYVYAENDVKHSILIYEYNKKQFVAEYFSIPDSLKSKNEILIKISSKEPNIWEFAE